MTVSFSAPRSSAQLPDAQPPDAQLPSPQTQEAQTQEAQTQEAQTQEAQTQEAQTPKTALVVDDSRAEQRLLAALLGRLGFEVAIADSGESALSWVEQAPQQPDLIVIDVVMPGISGFDLCRQLRDRAETASVPVIFCTSKGQEFDRFWGLRQGGSAYLVKPFAPQELIDAVQSCCSI